MLISETVERVAARLSVEGMTDLTFEVEAAKKKVEGCVAPAFCQRVVEIYPEDIQDLLKKWRLEKLGKKYGV